MIGALGPLHKHDSTTLRQAITTTFARRGTALPTNTPVGLPDEFAGDGAKQIQ